MRHFLTFATALVLAACGAAPELTRCGQTRCVAGQRCDVPSLLCVQDDAPTLTLNSVTGTVTTETFEVSGTVADDVGVAKVECTTSANANWVEATVNNGAFTCVVEAPVNDSMILGVTARVTEKTFVPEARAQTATATTQVLVDRAGPSFTLVTPLGTVGGAAVHVVVQVSDGSETVSDVKFFSGATSISAVAETGGFGADIFVPADLDAQTFGVQVSAKDKWNNTNSTTLNLIVDTAAPRIQITSPMMNSVAQGPNVVLTGTVTDASTVSTLTVNIADGSGPHQAIITGNTWQATFTAPAGEDRVSHSVTVIATDAFRNSNMAFSAFLIDSVSPRITITAPSPGQLFGSAATRLDILATIEDGTDGLAPVTATFNGLLGTHTGTQWQASLVPPEIDYSDLTIDVVAIDAAGNQKTASVIVKVDRVAPTVTLTSQYEGFKFNITNLAPTSNSVSLAWSVTDADPSAPQSQLSFNTTAFQNAVSPALIPTDPTDNGKAYTASVRATDRAGNTSALKVVHFTVDRVAPTVTSNVVNDQRNVATTLRLTFSEPVSGPLPTTDALSLSPTLTGTPLGTWNSAHDAFDVTASLAAYEVYTAVIGQLFDTSNNPLPSRSIRFHTAAATPASGTTLATNVYTFTAAADADGLGVLNVGEMMQGPNFPSWAKRIMPSNGQLDPTAFYSHQHAMASPVMQVTGWNVVRSDLTSQRNVGIHGLENNRVLTVMNTVPFTTQKLGETAPTSPFNSAVLVNPAITGETGTAEVGYFNGINYSRAAGPVIALPSTSTVAPTRILAAANRWLAIRLIPGAPNKIGLHDFACRTEFSPPNTCDFRTNEFNTTLSTTYQLSSAVSFDGQCAGLVYDTSQGLKVSWWLHDPTNVHFGSNVAPAPDTVSAAQGLRITPVRLPGLNGFGAVWQQGGNFMLGTAVPTVANGKCSVAFTQTGLTLPTSNMNPSRQEYEVVQLGAKLALLYIDTANNLKVFIP